VLLRPPTSKDLDAVFAVITARDTADLGAPDIVIGDLADRWNATAFNLAHDAIVAELDDDSGVAAYADVNRHGALIVVPPDHERDGIGPAMLEWAERRERELGHERFHQLIAATDSSGRALLEAAGYRIERHYWRMLRAFDPSESPAAPTPPPGTTIRTPDPQHDAARLHAVDDASFSVVPDYVPVSLTTFVEGHLEAHDLDLSCSSVVECDGEIVGFLLARRWEAERAGYVDLLAVHPAHQRQGVGSILLQTAFAQIAAAGLREAQLAVASDNPRALALYERLGMTVRFQHDVWARETTNSHPSAG
jgi:mycothiol synthase